MSRQNLPAMSRPIRAAMHRFHLRMTQPTLLRAMNRIKRFRLTLPVILELKKPAINQPAERVRRIHLKVRPAGSLTWVTAHYKLCRPRLV